MVLHGRRAGRHTPREIIEVLNITHVHDFHFTAHTTHMLDRQYVNVDAKRASSSSAVGRGLTKLRHYQECDNHRQLITRLKAHILSMTQTQTQRVLLLYVVADVHYAHVNKYPGGVSFLKGMQISLSKQRQTPLHCATTGGCGGDVRSKLCGGRPADIHTARTYRTKFHINIALAAFVFQPDRKDLPVPQGLLY